MAMYLKCKELKEEVQKVKALCARKVDENVLMEMDEDTLALLQASMRLTDILMDLMSEHVDTMNDLNRKLDKIMKKLEI